MIEGTVSVQGRAGSTEDKSQDCVQAECSMKQGEDGASSQVHPGTNPAGGEDTSAAAGTSDQGGSFDCNICLELAQDPVVTLCGHLFCWPCLYRWLQMHSICQECPVCKASVEEEKVIPLYGRGKVNCVDPRTKAVPGLNIPHRPAGQRPETARHAEHHYQHHGFNFMAGPTGPAATARFGNITLSAGFGLFPSLFGFQLHGFPEASGMGGAGIHLGTAGGLAGSHIHPTQPSMPDQQQEALLSRLLLLLGVFVIVCLLLFWNSCTAFESHAKVEMAESCLDMFCQADRDCNLLWHWSKIYWIGDQGQSSWSIYELWSIGFKGLRRTWGWGAIGY